MRKGTEYAKKVKKAYAKFRRADTSTDNIEPTDPAEQLIIAALSQQVSVARAKQALSAINEEMVDYNELRVSSPAEVADVIGDHIPHAVDRAQVLIDLLNDVFNHEYAVNLESLKSKGIRDAKHYLESLASSSPYIVASVMLWSLGGHAIPVNDSALECLASEDLVDPNATSAEVQSFLERNISASEAKAFCLDLEEYVLTRPPKPVASKKTAAKDKKTKAAKATKSTKTEKTTATSSTKKKSTTTAKKTTKAASTKSAKKTTKKAAPKKKTKTTTAKKTGSKKG